MRRWHSEPWRRGSSPHGSGALGTWPLLVGLLMVAAASLSAGGGSRQIRAADPVAAAAEADAPSGEGAAAPADARATDGASPPVAKVVLRLPITGTRDKQVIAAIQRQVGRLRPLPGQRPVLVVEFVPGDEGDVSDPGRAWELARFLCDPSLADVKTVAYLPLGVRGHAVLVALACEQIVVGPDATIGPAGTTAGGPADGARVDDVMRAAYAQIAAHHRTVPKALAVALVDPTARLLRASTDDGDQYIAADDLPALREKTAVLAVEEVGPAPLAVGGRRARAMGLATLLAQSPAELARGLGIDERTLLVDPLGTEGWKAAEVTIEGPITAETVARTERRIQRLMAEGVTFICLRIESRGGEPDQSLVLAGWLAALDPTRLRTVAYVATEARGDAGLVALACDDLVMAPRAVIGGPGSSVIDARRGEAITASWKRGVAAVRERSWSLPVALVRPGLVVHRASQPATGRVEFFSAEELAGRDDRAGWQLGPAVATGPVQLSAAEAEAYGLAGHVVDGLDGLAQAYGIDAPLRVAQPGWAEALLEALARPEVAWLLLLIGGAALVFELQTPGIGLGGFVATVAFVVYFWGQHLRGTSGSLEVMLFIVGLFCVAIEIFVLPGLGVLGLGGGLLMVAALVLASQDFVLPANDYQIRQLEWSLLGLIGAAVGVAVLGVMMRRWLPFVPGLRRALAEEATAAIPADAGLGLPQPGSSGTTTTRLAPAGKAMIDGQLVDVASDGPLIEPGVTVSVIALRGSRIIVRADVP